MSKKILVLDFALLILLVAGGLKLRSEWRAFGPAHDVASIQPLPQTFPALLASVAANAQPADWTEIPTHNLFSFDRSDIDIAPVVDAEPPKPLGATPILFGTMIIGPRKSAMVAPGPTGNKSYKEMGVGQEIDGWSIVDIQADSIVIESKGNRQTVTINDPQARVGRDAGKTAMTSPPTVIQASQQKPAVSATPAPVISTATGLPVVQPPPGPNGQPCTKQKMTAFGMTTVGCEDKQ